MRERVRNFMIGLASIVAVIAITVLLFFFGELEPLLSPRYDLTIDTRQAAGIRAGSIVQLNGVPIGVVETVSSQAADPNPVRVVAKIDEEIEIPNDAALYAETSLLGGASVLQLITTPVAAGTTVQMFERDGTARMVSEIRHRLFEEITAELDARMRPIEEALASFTELSETYVDVGRALEDIMSDNEDDPGIRTLMRRFDTVLVEVEAALGLAKAWLDDDQLRADVRAAVSKANTLIEKATESVQQWTTLAQSLETDGERLVKAILPVADELAKTLEEVQRVTALAHDGEGSVALFLNDPSLYNSLDDAATRLQLVLDEVRLMVEKMKAEGVKVDF